VRVRLWSALLCSLLLVGIAAAVEPEPLTVPPGTKFVVQAVKSFSSRDLKISDDVPFYLVHPVKIGSAKIPRGAVVTTKVIELVQSTPEHKPARIALMAEKITWPGGVAVLHALPISEVKKPKDWAKGEMGRSMAIGGGGASASAGIPDMGGEEPSEKDDPKPLDVNPGLAFDNNRGDLYVREGSMFMMREMQPQGQQPQGK
jgi:hypothetical protein